MTKKIISKDIFEIFLLILFPIHTWSIYQGFYNFEWIANRTVLWDAVGYGAYSLSWALLESFLVFIFALPIYLMLRKSQGIENAQALFGTVFYIFTIWMILVQVDKINNFFTQTTIEQIVNNYSLRYRYKIGLVALAAGLISITILVPPFLVKKFDKSISTILDFWHRIILLSYFYLFIDMVAIVIVVYRNLAT
jgi:hypothetical protein